MYNFGILGSERPGLPGIHHYILVFKAMEWRQCVQKGAPGHIMGELQQLEDRGKWGTKGKTQSPNISIMGIGYVNVYISIQRNTGQALRKCK